MPAAYDLVVIGGGPAGLAGAVTAAEGGARVAVVDENPRLGGQIWRSGALDVPAPVRPWLDRLKAAGVEVLAGTSVIDLPSSGRVETSVGALTADRLLFAVGARELLLPFPGWTRPGVVGAGGLQALIHSGLDVRDRRIVVAGSGPLLLQVASTARRHGAKVLRVAEQAPWSRLLAFGLHLGPARTAQAIGLASARFRASCWPLEAIGIERLEEVRLRTSQGEERLPCDYLAVGFGLVPNLELPRRLGCAEWEGGVEVDEAQGTSVDGVLAAGEVTGVKGAAGGLAEGVCAGAAAVGQALPASARRARARERSFAVHLARAFALRPELRDLPTPETLLCRCEDVPTELVRPWEDWSSAKLHSRCGMGACQGRLCGAATQFLFGWGPTGVRPPVLPTTLAGLVSSTPAGALSSSTTTTSSKTALGQAEASPRSTL